MVDTSNPEYEDYQKEYKHIKSINEFPTQFGPCKISLIRDLKTQKLYTLKEIQSTEQQLKPLHDFLNDLEVFQDGKWTSPFLVAIIQRFKYRDPKSSLVSIFIIQKDYNSYKLSKICEENTCEMEILVILRNISKLYTKLLHTPLGKAFLSASFIKALSPDSIFYYKKKYEGNAKKLNRDRLRVDFLDFNVGFSDLDSKPKENPIKKSKNLENLHLFEFGELIVQLLFNCSLTANKDTEEKPIAIEDLNKRVGFCLRSLFLRIFDCQLNVGKWEDIFTNPIINQDLERENDLTLWKKTLRDRIGFSHFKVYRKKVKKLKKFEEEESKGNLIENSKEEEKIGESLIKTQLIKYKLPIINNPIENDLEKDDKQRILKNLGIIRDEIKAYKLNLELYRLDNYDLYEKYKVYLKKMELALGQYKKSELLADSLEYRCYLKIQREYLNIKYFFSQININ